MLALLTKIMTAMKRKEKFWKFDTKAEALKKLEFLKNPDTYEVVQNRENGKIAKGWILQKRS